MIGLVAARMYRSIITILTNVFICHSASFVVLVVVCFAGVLSFDSRNVVFVIVGQSDALHRRKAAQLKQSLHNQLQHLDNRTATIYISSEDFHVPGDWTITPLLQPLLVRHAADEVRWMVFLEPRTVMRCDKLMQALRNADRHQSTMWIGYPLRDEVPSSNHHLAFFEELEEEGGFIYPHFGSGFAMRKQLMKRLLYGIETRPEELDCQFSMDPAFELARLIYGDPDGPGPLLTAEPSFCLAPGEHCATYQTQFDGCGRPIPEEEIFFAVKTWSGYHDSRAGVVKKTWGQYVTNILFFSDKADPSLPSVDVGVPNVKFGHCVKTVKILQMVTNMVKNKPSIKWIFLADDDTILGVQRLCEILRCFEGGSTITQLGERYGFGYNKMNAAKGFMYMTGGAGTAMSVRAAAILSTCSCTSASAPDDMALGACAARENVTMIHLPLFHQNGPQDYPREVLYRDRPVTFHGHSLVDPLKLYATWFQHDDLSLKTRRTDEL